MQLLGENLSVLRKRQPGKRFSLGTTCRLGVQMLSAIESMHDFGYLHRDIKPSNFCIGLNAEAKEWCFLIDFGLARRFTLPNGDIRTARDSAGFRGTARYASINSHLSKELARRDDMWSLFYLIIEFMKGSLPWSNIENKEDVGRRKIELDTPSLVDGLPPEMSLFMDHLRMLDYRHRPDYDYINNLFNQMLESQGIPEDEPYDWERNSTQYIAAPASDIHSAAQDVARSGAVDSRIPRPARTAGGNRSERKLRESPHDKAISVDGLRQQDARRAGARATSAASKGKSKRTGSKNVPARRAIKDDGHSTASGLGLDPNNASGNSSHRTVRSCNRRARSRRGEEAQPEGGLLGIDNQGSSDPTKRTLMRGKTRNSPMSNTVPDNDTIGAEDMVTASPEQHASALKQDVAILSSQVSHEVEDEPANEQEEQDLETPQKEGNEKGGSCRCVIS